MMRKMLPHAAACLSFALITSLVGCTGGTGSTSTPAAGGAASTPAAGGAAATPVDPAKAGAIAGKVKLDGKAPEAEPIDMSGVKECHAAHPQGGVKSESIVVNNGGLKNAIVYIKSGISGAPAATGGGAVLDQKGCMYTPHVLTIQTNAPLTIKNSDPTAHNVHALPKKSGNSEFNEGQPAGSGDIVKKFKTAEIVRIKCDIHSWMNAYVGVFDHPYSAVTSDDGSFEIKGVPPGTYKVEVWHEKLKTQEMDVTVGEKETKTVDFTFKAS